VFFFERELRFIFVYAVMLLMPSQIMADRIYQWVDAAGIRHFTNNESNIPSQYRVKVKDMKLQAVRVEAKKPPAVASGEKLWLERCAACHTPGLEGVGVLRPLASEVIDPATRFPRTPDVLSSILRGAVEGRTTDMKRMEISDADLLEIAHYLIEYSKKH